MSKYPDLQKVTIRFKESENRPDFVVKNVTEVFLYEDLRFIEYKTIDQKMFTFNLDCIAISIVGTQSKEEEGSSTQT